MTITVKMLAHSSHPNCPDLYTLEARYPRFIHAEVMTHRMFCRNASSSRAIPVKRLIEDVMNDPAMPVAWGMNQPGMQAGEDHDEYPVNWDRHTDLEPSHISHEDCWLLARDKAVLAAQAFADAGYHKQVVNRLLEPFAHISVIITATEWTNFFDLRCHPAADPTMRALAEAIRDAMKASVPTPVRAGCWHLPYATEQANGDVLHPMISAARAARVSYLNHDGTKPDLDKDIALATMLKRERHLSPFEHPATPAPGERHGPLVGWKNLRAFLEEEA